VEEESPEAILARLERYAARLRTGAAPTVPSSVRAPAPVARHQYVAASPAALARADDFIPPSGADVEAPTRHIGRSLLETGAMLAGLLACVLVIGLYMIFDRDIATVITGGLACVGVYGMRERVPLAGWATLGLAVGAALGLLS
jgi:hypothetical protein